MQKLSEKNTLMARKMSKSLKMSFKNTETIIFNNLKCLEDFKKKLENEKSNN